MCLNESKLWRKATCSLYSTYSLLSNPNTLLLNSRGLARKVQKLVLTQEPKNAMRPSEVRPPKGLRGWGLKNIKYKIKQKTKQRTWIFEDWKNRFDNKKHNTVLTYIFCMGLMYMEYFISSEMQQAKNHAIYSPVTTIVNWDAFSSRVQLRNLCPFAKIR